MNELLNKLRSTTKCQCYYYTKNRNCISFINNCMLYYNTYKQEIPMDIFNDIDFASNCFKKIDLQFESVFVNQIKYCSNDKNKFLDIINVMNDMQLIQNSYSKKIINDIYNDINNINYINIFIEHIFNYDNMLCDKITSYYEPFKNAEKIRYMIINLLVILENPKIDSINIGSKNILYSWCLYGINYIKELTAYYNERGGYSEYKKFDKTIDIQLTKFKNNSLNNKNFNPDNDVMIYSFLYDSYDDTMKICKSTNVIINKDTSNIFIIKLSNNMLLDTFSPTNLEKIINFLHENGSDPKSIKYEQIDLELSNRYYQKQKKNWIECISIIFNYLNENSIQISADVFKKLVYNRILLKNPQKSGIDVNYPLFKSYFYSINYNPYKVKFDSSIELLYEQLNKSGNLTKIKTLCKEVKPDNTCLQNACCHKNNIHTVRYFIEVHKLKVDINALMNLMSNVGNTTTRYIINEFKKDKAELDKIQMEKKIEMKNVDLEKVNVNNILNTMDSIKKIDNKIDKVDEKPKKKIKSIAKKEESNEKIKADDKSENKTDDKAEVKVEVKVETEEKPKKVIRRVVKKKQSTDDKSDDKTAKTKKNLVKSNNESDNESDNQSITSDRSILKTLKEIQKITEKNDNKSKIKVINKNTQNKDINLDEYIIPNEYDFRKDYNLTDLGKKIINVEKISHINLRKNLFTYLKDNNILKPNDMSIDNIKFNIKNIDKFISAQLLQN